jgi:hypothetical protein
MFRLGIALGVKVVSVTKSSLVITGHLREIVPKFVLVALQLAEEVAIETSEANRSMDAPSFAVNTR